MRLGPKTIRFWAFWVLVNVVLRAYLRIRVEGRENLSGRPCIVCFSHPSWIDPFLLYVVLPPRPRPHVFGPREADMRVGLRNRLIAWLGVGVPYTPGKNDLLDTTRRVQRVLANGGVLAIAGEGRIHAGETVLLPFNDGAAYFALRTRTPLIPLAINGLSWVRFGRLVRVRIGRPIEPVGRPTRPAIDELTDRLYREVFELTRGYPETARTSGFGGWLTELFNDWPEGSRPTGPPPADVEPFG